MMVPRGFVYLDVPHTTVHYSIYHIVYTGCFDKTVPIQTREHYVIKTVTRITIFNMHKIHIVTDVQQNFKLNMLIHLCVFAT